MYFHHRLVGAILWDSFCICKPWIYSPGTRMLTFLGLVISMYTFNLYLSPGNLGEQSPIGRSNWYETYFFQTKNSRTSIFQLARQRIEGLSAEKIPQHTSLWLATPPRPKKNTCHMSPWPGAATSWWWARKSRVFPELPELETSARLESESDGVQRSNGESLWNNGNKNHTGHIYIYTVYQDILYIYSIGDLWWHFYSAPISILYSSWWFQWIWTISKHISC